MMAAIFHLLRVTPCRGTKSPDEGAFSNSQCLEQIIWEQLCFFSIHNPTLANSSSSILSIAIYTQSICLVQIVPQSIRLISPTDFWKFPLKCPTGTSYSGLTHPNEINLSATHLEASSFKGWILMKGLPSTQLAKPEISTSSLIILSLSHFLHILNHHFWLILLLKCFLHHLMSILPYHPVLRHYLLSWITLISFLKVSLPLLSTP